MNKTTIATHNGTFHTDDVFAVATITLSLPEGTQFELTRTRDEEVIKKADFVVDVGGVYASELNRFDHHQPGGAGVRDNGIEYASFGLVWKKFGSALCGSQKAFEIIDTRLVSPIDAGDNGFDLVVNKGEISPYYIHNVFSMMNPTWKEDGANSDELFFKSVEIAKTILQRELAYAKDALLAEESLLSIYKNTEDKRLIVLDDNYPFEYFLHNFPEPIYAVYPRRVDNTWGVKAIKSDPKTFKNRKDFPKSWGGLRDQEFAKVSGVSDTIFCHKGLFMAVAKSKEGAIALAKLALNS